MPKFAVAYTNLFDNELRIEVFDTVDWKVALKSHTKISGDERDVFDGCKNIEDAREAAFNMDAQVDVVRLD
jgi:hypothetical protein